jgi:prephenate dehydrogenase
MTYSNHEQKIVGVIGGRGAFGQWCVRLFERHGHSVLVSDKDTELSNADLVRASAIVVVAVPIGVTQAVLEEVARIVTADQVVIDLTSVKSPFVATLRALLSEVLSLHPMFSPIVSSHVGQSCVACRIRVGELSTYVEKLLRSEGLNLVEMSADVHDRMMAVIQGLTHFQAIAAAHCMLSLGFSPEESLPIASPVYRLRLDMIGRIIAQDPRLYAEIQMYNPYVGDVLAELEKSSTLLGTLVKERDIPGFVAEFEAIREAFGTFTKTALEESDRVIRALAEK